MFVSPVLLLVILNSLVYNKYGGDLSRVGMISVDPDYRKNLGFSDEYARPIYYENLSDINLQKELFYDILTVGDSFSEQKNYGYQNYLSEKDSTKVLHVDIKGNPIESLYQLVNGDFFDNIKVNYVILQSVERHFVERAIKLDSSIALKTQDIERIFESPTSSKKSSRKSVEIFSSDVIKSPLYYLLYHLDDNAFFSKVYRLATDSLLFSYGNDLLCYYEDIQKTPLNNDRDAVVILNNTLNHLAVQLAEKEIKLIVLPSPDKFDIYFDSLTDKENYPKPLFFEHLRSMKKKYLYVDSATILTQATKKEKDIYFYDDTHWTPIASKLIANNILEIINDYTAKANLSAQDTMASE